MSSGVEVGVQARCQLAACQIEPCSPLCWELQMEFRRILSLSVNTGQKTGVKVAQ